MTARPVVSPAVLRAVSVALLVMLGGTLLLSLTGWVSDIAADSWDFRAAYWNNAGRSMNAGGADLYEEQAADDNKGAYIYPPQLATFFGVIYSLPYSVGWVIWMGVLLLSAVWTLWVAHNLARDLVPKYGLVFVALLAMTLFGAVYADVFKGNVNTPVAASMLTGLWLLERKRLRLGGVVLAGAAFLKVIPVVLIGWLVVTRQWRALGGVALGVLIWVHVPLVSTVPVYGLVGGYERTVALHVEYVVLTAGPRVAVQEATGVGGISVRNGSIHAVMARLFTPEHFAGMIWPDRPQAGPMLFELPQSLVKATAVLLACAMFAVGLFVASRRHWDWVSRVGGAGLVFVPAMLGNVLCWPFHLVSVVLIAAPMAALLISDRTYRWQCAAVLVLLFFGVTLMFRHEAWWLRLYGMQTFAVIATWALTAWVLWKRKQPQQADQPVLAAGASAD